MSDAPKTLRAISALLAAGIAVSVLAAAPASAEQARLFTGYFGAATSVPADPYPLARPSGVAVNQSTHDVYVGDPENDRVEEFSDAGGFVLMFGKAVNRTAVEEHRPEAEQDVCPATGHPSDVCQAGAAASAQTSPGAFDTQAGQSSSLFLAIDNSTGPSAGDVYVGDTSDALVQKFDGAGQLLASWGEAGHLGGFDDELGGLAVDASGNLWVNGQGSLGNGEMFEFNPEADRLREWRSGFVGVSPRGIAIDSEDDLYAGNGVYKFTASGEEVGRITADGTVSMGWVANPLANDLYVYEEPESFSATHAFIARYQLATCHPAIGQPCTKAESFGEPYLPRVSANYAGLAVDDASATDTLYAAASEAGDVAAFSVETVPGVSTDAASDITPTSVTLNGSINPSGIALNEGLEGCRFEWGETETYGHVVACAESAAQIGTGTRPVGVHADVTGLTPGVTYHYRLVAGNANDVNARIDQPSTGQDIALGPPRVDSESVSNLVTATTATLEAQVNPVGADAHARIEYLTEAEYQQNGEGFAGAHPAVSVPTPEADLGNGDGDQPLGVAVEGLLPDTVYRYRVVVQSVLGTVSGSTLAFTTQPARAPLSLPDGRQWELVSPPDIHGALLYSLAGSVLSNSGVTQVADDGGAITYLADAPTEAGPEGNANSVQVLSVRGPSGWSTRDVESAHSAATQGSIVAGEEYRLFSSDLSLGLLQPYGVFTPSLSPEAVEQGPYLRSDFSASGTGGLCTESCYRPLVTRSDDTTQPFQPFGEPCPRHELAAYFCGPFFEGASPNLEHVVIRSDVPLTETGESGLYEWNATAPSSEALAFIGDGQLGNGTGYRDTDHAVADDGSRVFFSPERESLAMRDIPSGETVTVSGGEFEDASADGSRVIYRENGGFYECRIATEADGKPGCQTTDLSPANGAEPAKAQGAILGASEDGTYVYFVADGVLATNVGADGTHATPGGCELYGKGASVTCNLYLWHEDPATGESTVTFVAALSQEDTYDWNGGSSGSREDSTAEVSPNGRWLAFMSERSLTGYDNRDAASGARDEEVYVYHAPAAAGEAGRLICASCNPTGARPHGLEGSSIRLAGKPVWSEGWVAGSVPGWIGPAHFETDYQPRYLSDAGRLFFDSSDALVPQDVNGTEDVYEYEPPASAAEGPPNDSCTTGSSTYSTFSGGCIDLISSGSSPEESVLLGSSENGNDMFFLSSAQLAGTDNETGLKVYDAHVCTGESPCPPPPPAPPPACEGDACQAPAGVLDDPTPASLTFQGAGNAAPAAPASAVKPKAKPPTRKQRLASALRACTRKPKHKRAECERLARRRYGAASPARRSRRGGGR